MERETVLVSGKFGIGERVINWSPMQYQYIEQEYGAIVQEEIIPAGMIKVELPIAESERFTRNNGHKKYKVVDGVLVYDETLPDYRGVFEMEAELEEIAGEMAANDYKQLKYMRGALPEDEWLELVAWYEEKTELYNNLREQIRLVTEEESV